MLKPKSKSIVKKTKRGAVLKVVREVYLRDDIGCGVEGCGRCKHHQQKPVLDRSPARESELVAEPHFLVPDTNVVLHQLDVLDDAAFSNVIVLQVVLEEVRLHLAV